MFLQGTLPERLAIGGEQPTADSPWWRFLSLAHLAREDAPHRLEEIRSRWRALESDLMISAYPLAIEAKREGTSLNTLAIAILAEGLGKREIA